MCKKSRVLCFRKIMNLFYFLYFLLPLSAHSRDELRPSYRSSVVEDGRPILRGGEQSEPEDVKKILVLGDNRKNINQKHLKEGRDPALARDLKLFLNWLRDSYGYEIAPTRRQGTSAELDTAKLRSKPGKNKKKKQKKRGKHDHNKGKVTLDEGNSMDIQMKKSVDHTSSIVDEDMKNIDIVKSDDSSNLSPATVWSADSQMQSIYSAPEELIINSTPKPVSIITSVKDFLNSMISNTDKNRLRELNIDTVNRLKNNITVSLYISV